MAEPLVTVFIGRHPQSKANEDDANYGNETPLTPKGEEQAAHIREWIKANRIDYILHSPANRCKAVFDGHDLGIPIESNVAYLERRRPSHTIGKKNNEVADDLVAMVENFGPKPPLWDEEEYLESVIIVEAGLKRFLTVHHEYGAKRMFCLTSGLRGRMYGLTGLHGGLDPEHYRDAYDRTGFFNAGIMELSYGPMFRKEEMAWRLEFASNHYLPEHLR
jgi:broad specificity phosphatase PhoE